MRIRLNIRQAKKRTPFADRIYNVKKLSTLSLSTVMLIVSVGCKAAKPDQTRSAVPTLLSFTTPNEPLSFWSKDDRNRSTPYVLWVMTCAPTFYQFLVESLDCFGLMQPSFASVDFEHIHAV